MDQFWSSSRTCTNVLPLFPPYEHISLPPRDPRSQSVDSYGRSLQFSVASGNLLSWRVPAECVPYVRSYTTGPQYQADVQAATSLALQQAQTFCARPALMRGCLMSMRRRPGDRSSEDASQNELDSVPRVHTPIVTAACDCEELTPGGLQRLEEALHETQDENLVGKKKANKLSRGLAWV
ncbi:hypothetical protein SELMODRAFT_404652 [Selaginella moellendorffii]|uniref:Uncharacterized protein n=1 Tax=Selaginella moellendorffii TaxID=88036 RepID=D8QVZ9_SELML|nr:hypothetical protein SELMODRAFT_404652 [Selaginella moellendorffii]